MKKIKSNDMVRILQDKLTKEEFFNLFNLIDSDGPAGSFWEGLAEKSERMFPEEFVLKTVSGKKEI